MRFTKRQHLMYELIYTFIPLELQFLFYYRKYIYKKCKPWILVLTPSKDKKLTLMHVCLDLRKAFDSVTYGLNSLDILHKIFMFINSHDILAT